MTQTRILLVDDDRNLTTMVRAFLSRTANYHVLEENCSERAMAKAREYCPDVVVLDLNMPGMDGAAIAAEFQTDPFLRNIPVIFLSGLIPPAESGIRRNGAIYLSKPFQLPMLQGWIETLLPEPQAPDAAAPTGEVDPGNQATSGTPSELRRGTV